MSNVNNNFKILQRAIDLDYEIHTHDPTFESLSQKFKETDRDDYRQVLSNLNKEIEAAKTLQHDEVLGSFITKHVICLNEIKSNVGASSESYSDWSDGTFLAGFLAPLIIFGGKHVYHSYMDESGLFAFPHGRDYTVTLLTSFLSCISFFTLSSFFDQMSKLYESNKSLKTSKGDGEITFSVKTLAEDNLYEIKEIKKNYDLDRISIKQTDNLDTRKINGERLETLKDLILFKKHGISAIFAKHSYKFLLKTFSFGAVLSILSSLGLKYLYDNNRLDPDGIRKHCSKFRKEYGYSPRCEEYGMVDGSLCLIGTCVGVAALAYSTLGIASKLIFGDSNNEVETFLQKKEYRS